MNNFKNFVIFVLSLIILVQAAFLIDLLSHRQALKPKEAPKKAEVAVPAQPAVIPGAVEKAIPVPMVGPGVVLGKIALVLDDWGYNLKNKNFITDNDYHVTISILPFRAYSTHIAQLAYHKNKDVIVHMPMEPLNKENYKLEENTLLTGMDKKTVVRLLGDAFSVVPYAKGLSNHMGSRATEDPRLMKIVFEYLKNNNFFFLDSLVTSQSVCRRLAKSFGIGFTQRDIFIDNDSDPASIKDQLYKLAKRAQRTGVAVGIGHDRSTTIAVLKEVIPQLEREGYQFVNLSQVLER